MKIAIVGGSGFIGRNLAKALHSAGEEVIIFLEKFFAPRINGSSKYSFSLHF